MTVQQATRRIREAKAAAERVEQILDQLGQTNPAFTLGHRFSNVMAEPLELAGNPRVFKLRTRLAAATDDLAKRLARDFVG